jgi:hypothetical protein
VEGAGVVLSCDGYGVNVAPAREERDEETAVYRNAASSKGSTLVCQAEASSSSH